MNKNKFINLFAFLIGIYLIVRAYFLYVDGNRNLTFVYLSIGVLAIVLQLVVNYLKKNKEE